MSKILKNFREIIREYLNRNEDTLFSDNVIHEMNGVVLQKTNNAIFNFYGTMIDEVIAYCKEQGCKPDKIVFVSSYDIEVEDAEKMRMQMEADSKISVVEEDGLKIARVCICERVAIKENHGYGA
jgi:hypothetical protein